MTHIDFHVNIAARTAYVCRLTRKARAAGKRVVIFCADANQLADIDHDLWTFSPLDFLPHCYINDKLAEQTPIILTSSAVDTPHHEVLINLDQSTPEFFSRFERLLEVVSDDEEELNIARARWKYYKDRGYPLKRHEIGSS